MPLGQSFYEFPKARFPGIPTTRNHFNMRTGNLGESESSTHALCLKLGKLRYWLLVDHQLDSEIISLFVDAVPK